MSKLKFSGHDSFHCRALWLRKGYDFIKEGNKFDEEATVELGVGKNMVNAINYWMKSFQLVDQTNKFSELAEFIFGKDGVDRTLEDITTLWLLHYHLVTENIASIYSLVFNEFRKQRIEFSKKQLHNYLIHKCAETKTSVSENTITRDITVFLRNYLRPKKANKNLEEMFSGLFIDLDLIEGLKKFEDDDYQWYKIENKDRNEIPKELILYAILDYKKLNRSISFDELHFGFNRVGNVFALSSKGLLDKINALIKSYKNITFTDDAGIRVLQIKHEMNKWDILRKYYEKK
ncbi:MAG: DUF4007 family protein [Ignavibacteriales bacterium]|nr:DUF4007 family protein [Ignavibacteriales bacterium]